MRKKERPKNDETGEKQILTVQRCETWKEPGIKRSYLWFSSDS